MFMMEAFTRIFMMEPFTRMFMMKSYTTIFLMEPHGTLKLATESYNYTYFYIINYLSCKSVPQPIIKFLYRQLHGATGKYKTTTLPNLHN